MQSLRQIPRQFLAWLVLCVAMAGLTPMAYALSAPDATMPEWCSASMVTGPGLVTNSGAGHGAPAGDAVPAAAWQGSLDQGVPGGASHHCVLCAMGDLAGLPPAAAGQATLAGRVPCLAAAALPLEAGLALRPWLARAPPR